MKIIKDKLEDLEKQIVEIDFTKVDSEISDLTEQINEKRNTRNELVRQLRLLQAEIDLLKTCLKKINELRGE